MWSNIQVLANQNFAAPAYAQPGIEQTPVAIDPDTVEPTYEP